jgi:hypothetical protein
MKFAKKVVAMAAAPKKVVAMAEIWRWSVGFILTFVLIWQSAVLQWAVFLWVAAVGHLTSFYSVFLQCYMALCVVGILLPVCSAIGSASRIWSQLERDIRFATKSVVSARKPAKNVTFATTSIKSPLQQNRCSHFCNRIGGSMFVQCLLCHFCNEIGVVL